MLTGRSVLIFAIILAVLSLLGMVVSLMQPPDREGLGSDSYGTRARGYKAVFDLLEELKAPSGEKFVPRPISPRPIRLFCGGRTIR